MVTRSPEERRRRNTPVIEELRANGGQLRGERAGQPLLLLTTTGARSGRPHTTPMLYLRDGERLVVFASKGGEPTHPDWFHNLQANPRAAVEVGAERFEVRAEVVTGPERDELFARQVALHPQFADYQAATTRQIPVVALVRIDGGNAAWAAGVTAPAIGSGIPPAPA